MAQNTLVRASYNYLRDQTTIPSIMPYNGHHCANARVCNYASIQQCRSIYCDCLINSSVSEANEYCEVFCVVVLLRITFINFSFPEKTRVLQEEQAKCKLSKGMTCILRVQVYNVIITINYLVGHIPFMMQTVSIAKLCGITC